MNKINVGTDRQTYRIRFRYQGVNYVISHGSIHVPQHKALMQKIATDITLDISLGQFDSTLKKYKPWLLNKVDNNILVSKQLVSYWDDWVHEKVANGVIWTEHQSRYSSVRIHLVNLSSLEDSKQVDALITAIGDGVKPETFNNRLSLLKSWCKWLIKHKHTSTNPFEQYDNKRGKGRKADKPFTVEQLQRILATCKQHQEWSDYYPYLLFLANTGCRPSEAIGLRWADIDWVKKTVTISSSLKRNEFGQSSSSKRIRSTTKTGNSRDIPLSGSLQEYLSWFLSSPLHPAVQPENLVFLNHKHDVIDDDYFRLRVWKPLLKECGIPYVRPYILRHTLISHLVESGASLIQAAAIAGHKDTRLISTTYGHMVNLPTMPEF